MTINRRVAGKLLAGSTLAFTAGAARAQSSDDLIAAAKREGKVVVYSAYVSPVTNEPIAKAFEKKYGVSVETFMARGPELRERIQVEQMTGHLLGDVQHNAITTTTIGINQDGNVQPHGNLSGVARLKPEFAARSDDLQVPIFTINYGILVNANLVKPEDEPKSWNDLLNPKWKGRILLDDPRATGGGRVMFHMTMDRFGRAFHDALARQEPVFSRDYGEAGRRLARGEFALYAPLLFSQVGRLKGLPIRAGGRRGLWLIFGVHPERRRASQCRAALRGFLFFRRGAGHLRQYRPWSCHSRTQGRDHAGHETFRRSDAYDRGGFHAHRAIPGPGA